MSKEEMGSAQPNDAVGGGQGGESGDAGSAGQQQQQQQTNPNSRMLGEIKALKQQLAETKTANESLQMQKLEQEGNKDKTIEFLQAKVANLESQNKEREQKLAFQTLGSQVKTEAAKMGCQNPDDLIKLMDLKGIPVDPDTYTGDTDSIRVMLEDQKKSRPFFFGKAGLNVQDVNQQNTILNKPQKDYGKMTREELDAEIAKLGMEKFD